MTNNERQDKVRNEMPNAALVNILLYVVGPILFIAFIILSSRILEFWSMLTGGGS